MALPPPRNREPLATSDLPDPPAQPVTLHRAVAVSRHDHAHARSVLFRRAHEQIDRSEPAVTAPSQELPDLSAAADSRRARESLVLHVRRRGRVRRGRAGVSDFAACGGTRRSRLGAFGPSSCGGRGRVGRPSSSFGPGSRGPSAVSCCWASCTSVAWRSELVARVKAPDSACTVARAACPAGRGPV